VRLRLSRVRTRAMGRRLQLLLALAVVATALGAVTASGASFVSESSTAVQASTSALSSDTLTIVAGDDQTAIAGTAVAIAPSVQILDGGGNPVSSLTVTFSIQSGGGSFTGGTVVTGIDGIATLGSWTLGSTPGANTLRATCAGVTPSYVDFTATGTSGPAVAISINTGDGQNAVAGTWVPIAPSVKVVDAGGNPVGNVDVQFSVASGGGSVTGGNTKTNAAGIASVNRWTLGTTAGVNTLTATSPGLTGSPVTFTATGTAGAAARIAVNDGNNQTVHVGTPVFTPPSVLVTDANNNPVQGVAVTFSMSSGGGSITGANATSNASGIARVGSWTLGLTAGTNTLRAASAGLTGSPVTFTATGLTGSPTTITLYAGNGQTATAGAAVATDPSVRVTDVYNNPVAGVAVTFAAASGGGSVTGASVTTDASGIAAVGSWTLGTTAGANTLTATSPGLNGSPILFTATGTAGSASRYVVTSNNYSPAVGSPVLISAQLADQYNNPVAQSGVGVTFSKSPNNSGSLSGASPATNSSGVATVTLTVGTTVGTSYTVTATTNGPTRTGTSPAIVTVAATPTRIALSAGNSQTATVNTAVATAPSVLVTDAYGNPVSGVAVTFAVASGGGSVTGANATTNASGIAVVGNWTLGTVAGANTLTATCAGLTGSPVIFTATGVAGPQAKYVVTASNYNPIAGAAVTITAQLTDQYGNPVARSGLRVRWSKTGKGGWFTATRTTTNAGGIATTTFYTSSTVGRVHTVTARTTNPATYKGTTAAITTR
jgi:adhesin/invasin